MPHYYFDIHDGIHVEDDDGQSLPDLTSARDQAMRIAASHAITPTMLGEDGGAVIVLVRDASDDVVANVRLVFSIEAGPLRVVAHQ